MRAHWWTAEGGTGWISASEIRGEIHKTRRHAASSNPMRGPDRRISGRFLLCGTTSPRANPMRAFEGPLSQKRSGCPAKPRDPRGPRFYRADGDTADTAANGLFPPRRFARMKRPSPSSGSSNTPKRGLGDREPSRRFRSRARSNGVSLVEGARILPRPRGLSPGGKRGRRGVAALVDGIASLEPRGGATPGVAQPHRAGPKRISRRKAATPGTGRTTRPPRGRRAGSRTSRNSSAPSTASRTCRAFSKHVSLHHGPTRPTPGRKRSRS